jgi:hypothetical protein
MAVNYFNKFPKVFFGVNNDGNFSIITDITKTVDINTFDEDSVTYYTFQEIGDGERPDSLSYSLYGTPQYYWTFFVINDSLKAGLGNAWPLNSHAFENMMINEYDDYSAITFNPVLHNSLVDGKLTLNDAANRSSDFSIVPLVPIDNLLTPVDDEDQYLPYLRLVTKDGSTSAKILRYDNATCQLVVYDIRDNVETSVNITNGGSGYTAAPTVTFSAPPEGGTTATGISVVGSEGNVSSIFVTNSGSGYITPPTVTFSEYAILKLFPPTFRSNPRAPGLFFGGGSGIVGPLPEPVADTSLPPLAILRSRIPGISGNDIRIKFTGISGGPTAPYPPASVTSVDVSGTDITVNYSPIESLLTLETVKAALEADESANNLIEMIIQSQSIPLPPVWSNTFTSLSGEFTTAVAVLNLQEGVSSVEVLTNSDVIYKPAPTVTFSAPPAGGTTATGISVVGSEGNVSSVVITNSGSGYVTNPTVTFSAPPAGGTTAIGTSVVSKPASSRKSLLNAQTFKLLWVNPYTLQTAEFNNNEILKARFVTAALEYFEVIDDYYYPGRIIGDDDEPTYKNNNRDREKYIFDKNYYKVIDSNSKVYSWELYRNATAQYTSTQNITIDGETVTTTIPVTIYDVLYPQDPLNPPPINVLSFYEKEENANNDKRNIKVIRPEVINRFAKTYFDLLNT